jgi:hypothetical protein
VRVSNTSGSSAGSGSGDFHQVLSFPPSWHTSVDLLLRSGFDEKFACFVWFFRLLNHLLLCRSYDVIYLSINTRMNYIARNGKMLILFNPPPPRRH